MALYKILIDGFQSESFNLKELVDIGDTLYINKVDTMLDQGKVFPANLRDSPAFRIEIQKSYELLERYGSLSSIKKLLSAVEK